MLTSAATALAALRVALVFDDGPDAGTTTRVLRSLAAAEAQATFSYLGRQVEAHPELARAAVAAGHELNNHSYSHPRLPALDDAGVTRELGRTSLAIEWATGRPPAWLWAPFLDRDERVDRIAKQAVGLAHFPHRNFHFISSGDWDTAGTDAAAIFRQATTGVRDGSIILFHEWRAETAEQLPAILAELRRQGCEFLTLTQLAAAFPVAQTSSRPPVEPLPYRVDALMPDTIRLLSPSAITLDGWLGARVRASETHRLLTVDTEPLLAGFRRKPGAHPWIGEHVGKWLDAATLAWANSGDSALRAKLDRVAAELIAAQGPDGYLGTYLEKDRWTEWDVWSHKYCLIGLLTYHRYTASAAALAAARRAADLLLATFPAQKSILAAGTHEGMAATSVLEPMVQLYRLTADGRYLDFAHYLVRSWDEPKGPALLTDLLAGRPVAQVANAKAYEMLSNLVGLCELARVTGDRAILQAVDHAWRDIVADQLYLTGGASVGEHFRADPVRPNDVAACIGETCVTVTWIQLNLQLLRLTGEARFGDELERSFYNHLTGAQHPRGDDWCYYTALEGVKSYDRGITCCHSSGPRGLALTPQSAYLIAPDTLYVGTLETSRVTFEMNGQPVTLVQQSRFPYRGESVLTVHVARPVRFALKIRVASWAAPLITEGNAFAAGWAGLEPREWRDGDRIVLGFNLKPWSVAGASNNQGRTALAWGPFVLACDLAASPGTADPVVGASWPTAAPKADGSLAFTVPATEGANTDPVPATLLPFADVGADGEAFRVWLRSTGMGPVQAP